MRKRGDWTTAIWRFLVFCTLMTGLAAMTGILWMLSPVLQALALLPGLLVTLCLIVAEIAKACDE